MRRLALFVAAAACFATAPALAGSPASADRPIVLAEEFCVGPACVGVRDRDEYRYRHRESEGCREVTVRERRDGEIVERRTRRCD
jgi:hypothetical protein